MGQTISLSSLPSPLSPEEQAALRAKFDKLMRALFRQQGANLDINILASDDAQQFIEAHASTLNSAFTQVKMSDAMRRRLQRSDYIFSGIKTFHELNEAFPSLLDENGNRKPFEQFLNDVRKIDQTYNENYLRSEYNFAQASAAMAAKWETFMEDGDRYNLQYRTAGDDRVRPTHAALEGVTLPPSDPFWESYLPPNGWGCRCTTVQVRKKKYPETPHDEAMERGAEALQDDTKGMFRFNSGKEQKTFPDYNPYTISRCRDCDIAKGKLSLAFVPENILCDGCQLIHTCEVKRGTSYKFGKGEVHINAMVNLKDSDFEKLKEVAEFFAKDGAYVELTPKMKRPPLFRYRCVYESLVGTKYQWKCPDIKVVKDGTTRWYEHEGFITENPENAMRNMLRDGLIQSDRIIIDKPNLTDAAMKRKIRMNIMNGKVITEVWLKEGKTLRLLYKKSEE